MDSFFHKARTNGAEGLIMKRPDSPYEWGSRSWYWIKLKESYRSKMIEPVDLVIVGAWYGKGRRAGKLGAFLLSCYDPKTDTFPSISKVGTGFSDENLDEMTKRLTKLKRVKRHPRVDSTLVPDLWIDPKEVLEILGDEISISPIHRTAYGQLRKDSGVAIRFPRFTGRWRPDKGPEDATTVEEVLDMYEKQTST
jgi:DNA ligase-1